MYLRRTRRRTRGGGSVGYLQLAHNVWDPLSKQSRVRVLYSFGREDVLDRAAIVRLIGSLQRALEPGEALATAAGGGLEFVESRAMGGAWALDGLWRMLGIGGALERLLVGRRLDARAERVIFAMVANRALEPLSELAGSKWVRERAWIDRLDVLDEDACYRAMDWLLEIEGELAEQVCFQTADLLNLEVDLLFFDTTSTYFERDEPESDVLDGDGEVIRPAFRVRGHSKDHRPDLPQVVIGMAVTRTGIPIRVWCWPGNTNDSELIREVKDELHAWKLGRVVWVAEGGFQSGQNRRYLQRAGGHYVIGEKLRSNSREAAAALSRQGRYHEVAGNLRVKEVRVDDGTMRDRFVVCHNPDEAARDQQVRQALVDQIADLIADTDRLPAAERAKRRAEIEAKRGHKRYLRATATGLLRIDRAAVNREAHLDGKYLLRTSDPTLSTEDVALAYKQLLQVERGWRDMKTTLDLRPVRHRKEDRIRAHVILCWLALLLIRIAEHQTDDTWTRLRDELQRLHVGTFTGPAGTSQQRTQITSRQHDILRALNIPEPPRFLALNAGPHAESD